MATDLHKIREIVLLLLYSFDMSSSGNDELVTLLKEECKVSRELAEMALSKAKKVVASLQHIDQLLEKISHSYSIERLQTIERNVLRLGIFELAIEKELPPKVVLAEAKRLAKKFSTDEASTFVQTLLVALCEEESIEISPIS